MSMSECCSFHGIVYPIRYGVSTVFHNERAICLTYFPHLRFHRLIVFIFGNEIFRLLYMEAKNTPQ